MGKYKKKVGGRPYRNWTDETRDKAVEEIRSRKLTYREAEERYGIHRNTLLNAVKGKVSKCFGGQTVFSKEEEEVIVSHLIILGNFGFPLSKFELRLYVKEYLRRLDRKVPQFQDNCMTGKDWAQRFLERHSKQLSQRFSQSISRLRAGLNRDVICDFFNHLEKELDGIPNENVWNYDETNLQDDPGSKKVIVRRGTKHPEIITNATKVSFSAMLCGSAAGKSAPLYVTYKAENIYPEWMLGAPAQTRFGRSKSGWFDSAVFEDWFEFLMLPILRRLDGTKLLIGDNLSSHLNSRVIELCEKNNIRFIALPPNSTHLMQPLDVAFFRPLKYAWRSVISEWKQTSEGRRMASLPKTTFPHLLSQLMGAIQPKVSQNLMSGFRATGIFPLNRENVLKKLCDAETGAQVDHVANVSASFLEQIQTKRNEICTTSGRTRTKKVNVPSGRGITMSDLPTEQPSTSTNRRAKNSNKRPMQKGKSAVKGKMRRVTINEVVTSSSEDSDDIPYAESDDSRTSLADLLRDDPHEQLDIENMGIILLDEEENLAVSTNRDDIEICVTEVPNISQEENEQKTSDIPKSGDYVAVKYGKSLYPGKMMMDFDRDGDAKVSAMTKVGKHWKWPEKPDMVWYNKRKVLRVIGAPTPVGGGVFLVDMKP